MVLEVGGKGAAGSRISRNALDRSDFHGFGSGREEGAGFRIIRNAWDCHHSRHFDNFSWCLQSCGHALSLLCHVRSCALVFLVMCKHAVGV